jgi:hypothetical protein
MSVSTSTHATICICTRKCARQVRVIPKLNNVRKNECRNEFYGRAVNSRPPCGGASKQGACMSPTAQQCVRLPCRFACDGPMPPKAHSAGCGQAGSGRRAAPPPQSIVWLSACPDICSAGDSPGGGALPSGGRSRGQMTGMRSC